VIHRAIRSVLLVLVAFVATSAPTWAQGVMPVPVQQFLDNSGNPANGGKLCTYAEGTTTPLTTYSDYTLSTPSANPVVMDAAGRPTSGGVYLSAAGYKFILKTAGSDGTCATGTTLWTQDHVYATAPANLASITGKVTYTAASTLTVSSNAIVPTQNVHALDTSGGAANLNTVTTTNTSPGFILYLTANNGGANPVTVKNGAGNLSLAAGDYTMSAATNWITLILKGTTWYELGRAGTSVITNNSINSFRATLTSGTCVTTADVTAATTVYWTPCSGYTVALYDGASWNVRTSSELSIAVPATTNTMYDLFVYDNAGTPTLELTAWSNDTTRATALVLQNGALVKSGAVTRRYVSSFRTTAVSGQTEDSFAKRLLWNYFNRVIRELRVTDAASTWTYQTAAFRCVNTSGSCTNQVAIVVGVAEVALELEARSMWQNATAAQWVQIAIGTGSTSAATSTAIGGVSGNGPGSATLYLSVTTSLKVMPAIGYQFYAQLEAGSGAGTTTWYGTSAFISAIPNTGLHGTIIG
jgi:hypothetical protein